ASPMSQLERERAGPVALAGRAERRPGAGDDESPPATIARNSQAAIARGAQPIARGPFRTRIAHRPPELAPLAVLDGSPGWLRQQRRFRGTDIRGRLWRLPACLARPQLLRATKPLQPLRQRGRLRLREEYGCGPRGRRGRLRLDQAALSTLQLQPRGDG